MSTPSMQVNPGSVWRRRVDLIPRPWSRYVSCHGTPRRCYWFPRLRDSLVCWVLGHDWYRVWDDKPEVMCSRCAIGPFDPEEEA